MRSLILTSLTSFIFLISLNGQCNFDIDSTLNACQKAPFICGFNLHNYMGTLADTLNSDGPDPLCDVVQSSPENIQWLRFFTCETYIELLIKPQNCTQVMDSTNNMVSGMQAGIFADCDFEELLSCSTDGNTTEFTISASNIDPGEMVHLFLDGIAGSVCDFEIIVVAGIDTTLIDFMSDPNDVPDDGEVQGPDTLCVGSSAEYTFKAPTCVGSGSGPSIGCNYEFDSLYYNNLICYEWVIEPDSGYTFIGDSTAAEVTIQWDSIGEFTVDVNVHVAPQLQTGLGGCGSGVFTCGNLNPLDVVVVPPDYIYNDPVIICEGDTYDYCGSSYSSSVIVECEIDSCLIEVQEIIVEIKEAEFLSFEVCDDCIDFMGQLYCAGFHVVDDFVNCVEYNLEIFETNIFASITSSNDITCDQREAQLEVTASSNEPVVYSWRDSQNNDIGSGPNLIVSFGGNFTCFVTAPSSGCLEVVSTFVDEDTTPLNVSVDFNDIDCINSESLISYSASATPSFVEWALPDGSFSNEDEIASTQNGVYTLYVLGDNGCETIESFEVKSNVELPIVELNFSDDVLWCQESQITVDFINAGPNQEIFWFDGNNNPLNSQSTQFTITESGFYSVEVTDVTSNCTTVVDFQIDNNPDQLVDFIVDYEELICHDLSQSTIGNLEVIGGAQPLTYRLNGQPVSEDEITNLNPGVNALTIEDANGCIVEHDLVVEQASKIEYSFDPVVDINYSEDGLISIEFLSNRNLVDQVTWEDENGEIIGNSEQLSLSIENDQVISVEITDIYGCVYNENIRLRSVVNESFYIPNIFSPNEDGTNDRFNVFTGPSPGQVELLQVFDRWGNLVFKTSNMEFSNNDLGWDGKHKGKDAPVGVYAYLAQIDLGNGLQKTVNGSVTLVR